VSKYYNLYRQSKEYYPGAHQPRCLPETYSLFKANQSFLLTRFWNFWLEDTPFREPISKGWEIKGNIYAEIARLVREWMVNPMIKIELGAKKNCL